MNFFRLTFFVFPLLFSQPLLAAQNDIDEDITNPGTGTFPLSDNYAQPKQKMEVDKQLEMERPQEEEYDGFGEEKYNNNVNPDIYNPEEDVD